MRSNSPRKKPPTVSPLVELTECLNHLSSTVDASRAKYLDALYNPRDGQQQATPSTLRRLFRRTNSTPTKAAATSSSSRSLTPTRHRREPQAVFLELPDSEVLVENMRRIAELVVIGENYVTSQQKKEEAKFRRDQENWKAQRDMLGEDLPADEPPEEVQEDEREHQQEYAQLFDLFFERGVLETLINLLTGSTFQLSETERKELEATEQQEEEKSGDEKSAPGTPQNTKPSMDKVVHLPSFTVATQALQSVSILIQNVSRATSLYVILSNNRINELINLPLDLYSAAERHRQMELGGETQPRTFTSPEFSELTTHFITFLKSLALRMNVNTLQFFLKYPSEAAVPVSPTHFSDKRGFDDEAGPDDELGAEPEVENLRVEFPLYERALEFCEAHQDSFVRTTALNICLNTLRLTTIAEAGELPGAEAPPESFSLGSSPDGVLHDAKALPFRERLAIAQYTCIPSRVERLISPIFTKLAERWNSIDEQIREIDSNKDLSPMGDPGDLAGSRFDKMAKAKEKVRRERLIRAFKDRAADMQDELLLLEDVFKVGLTVLNEQLVEMMLATFVYPLLLQPLLLYYQRLSAALEGPMHSFADHPFGGYPGDYSDIERNLSPVSGPAKTSLLTLASVFQFLSNQPLLRLIYTALVHPLSPDSSGVPTLRSKLVVAARRNGRQSVRLDIFVPNISGDRTTYDFGTSPGNRRELRAKVDLSMVEDGGEACVFVLAPALAEVLEFDGSDMSLIARTRPNAYRAALLRCLNVPAELSDVRDLAICVLDAALTACDSRFAADVLFGTDMKAFADDMPADERNLDSAQAYEEDDRGIGGSALYESRTSLIRKKGGQVGSDLTNDVLSALCRCVIVAGKHLKRSSEWKLEYDEVAAHALLCCTRGNGRAMTIAAKTMDQLWRQAASFIATIPSSIQAPMGGSSLPMEGAPSINAYDYEELVEGRLLNFVFYDSAGGQEDTEPAANGLFDLAKKIAPDSRPSYMLPISYQSAFNSITSRIGRFLLGGVDADVNLLSDKEEVLATRLDATALLQLDSLVSLLKDLAATDSALVRNASLSGIAITVDGVVTDTKIALVLDVTKRIYAPLSSSTTDFLFGVPPGNDGMPLSGSVVDLSGKTLLPCVCEAPANVAALFENGQASGVVAEGITWHSLYLVFFDGFLVLAQPQANEAGSIEGRVITSCRLERLLVQKDTVVDDSGPPARRLMLSHHWFDLDPPPLFLFDAIPEPDAYGPFVRRKPVASGLDVWFEDQRAADRAYQILMSQIFTAKARRGARIKKYLAPEEVLEQSSY